LKYGLPVAPVKTVFTLSTLNRTAVNRAPVDKHA
jgi:hypothetical protein